MCKNPAGFSNLVHDSVGDRTLQTIKSEIDDGAGRVTCLIEALCPFSSDNFEGTR